MYRKKIKKQNNFFVLMQLILITSFSILCLQPVYAGFNDCAVPWDSFSNFPGYTSDYTYKGLPIRDHESVGSGDPTHGSANVPPAGTDLASGASAGTNPGIETTPFFGYYDGGTPYDPDNPSTMLDDYVFFRMRLDGDPSSNKNDFKSYHWNVLFDIDGDGYKEYWIDIDGGWDSTSKDYDRIQILYSNLNSQRLDPEATGVRREQYRAYNTDIASSLCPDGSPGFSHTRVIPTGDGDYWIEEQIPFTAFTDENGNQVLYPDSPVAFVFSTGASNQDPLQKDWMMDLNYLTDADPITFGDIIYPNGKPQIEFADGALNFVSYYRETDSDEIYVYVVDRFANTDSSTKQTIQVTVTDPLTGDDETINLIETGNSTGIFTNAGMCSNASQYCAENSGCPTGGTCNFSDNLYTSFTSPSSDNSGTLYSANGNTLYVSYTNPNSQTVTDQAIIIAPCTPFIEFTRANGLPSSNFILNSDTNLSDKLYVTIYFPEANTNSTTTQTISVDLTGNDIQSLTLTETGVNTGVFRNTTGLSTKVSDGTVAANDNLWEDIDGGTVTATYNYSVGGCTGSESTTASIFVTPAAGRVYFTNPMGTQDVTIYGPNQPVYIKVVDGTYTCSGMLGVTVMANHCSSTVTTFCLADGNCPSGETCVIGDYEYLTLTQTSTGSGIYMNRKNDLVTTENSAVVTSASSTFADDGVTQGDLFIIHTGANAGNYTVQTVTSNTEITLTTSLGSTASDISFTVNPLMTATFDGSYTANDGILENIDGYALGVAYEDCSDGDNDSTNNYKTDTAKYNAPSIVINEVLFYPDKSTCQTEYIQLYNNSPSSVNVTGYRVTAGASTSTYFDYTIPQYNGSDISIGPGKSIFISIYDPVPGPKVDSGNFYLFAQAQRRYCSVNTNITCNVDSDCDSGQYCMAFPSDDLRDPLSPYPSDQILLFDASGSIVDYVAWSNTTNPDLDFLSDDQPAVAAQIWQDDAFKNTAIPLPAIQPGQSIKRSVDGYDTNVPSDWTYSSNTNVCSFLVTYSVISSFNASSENGRVTVEWETASEQNTVGFYLQRLDKETGQYIYINNKILPGLITSPQGGAYRYIDISANPNEENAYLLIEIENTGKQNTYGPFYTNTSKKYLTTNQERWENQRAFENIDAQYMRAEHKTYNEKKSSLFVAAENKFQITRAQAANKTCGNAIKFAVREDGIYFLDAATISSLLCRPYQSVVSLIKTKRFALSNRNDSVAYLPDIKNEGIIFYGEGIDSIYTEDNVYWLTQNNGLLMRSVDGIGPTPHNGGATFTENLSFEKDNFPAIGFFSNRDADYWFWDYIIGGLPGYDSKVYNFEFDAVADTSQNSKLTVNLQGATNTDHHAVVFLNGEKIGESKWYGLQRHVFDISFSQEALKDGGELMVTGVLDPDVPFSIFYVDSFDFEYHKLYEARDNNLLCFGDANPVVTINGFTNPNIVALNLSDPKKPLIHKAVTISGSAGNHQISFIPQSPDAKYLATTLDALKKVDNARADIPSNLKNRYNYADYLVITTDELFVSAKNLARYRQLKGLSAKVVLLEDVMDDFNYGIYSPEAIRTFLSHAYTNWIRPPRFVVLAGDGSLDYKNILGNGDNLIPPMMVETPYGLFPSDNYFADTNSDHIPEMAVGRIPVVSSEELNNYISAGLGLGKSYEFGHSFFMKMRDIAKRREITHRNLETLFNLYLRPTLKEYLRAVFAEMELDGKLDEALNRFKSPLR